MTKILCNYNNATVKCLDMYTSGMVGAEISFEFSEEWEGLTKTAVFSAGDVQRDVLIVDSNVITIPWEVLQHAKEQLIVGVYGTNGTELVIPTVYASLGRIKTGADPSGDPGIPPTPSILDQAIQAAAESIAGAQSAAASEAAAAQILEEVKDVQTGVQAQIDAINDLIPEDADPENKLATESLVNDAAGEIIDKLGAVPVVVSSSIDADETAATLVETTVNLNTGADAEHLVPMPIANTEQVGMMTPEQVAALQNALTAISALQGQTVRLLYVAGNTPTAAEIQAFVISHGYDDPTKWPGFAVVVAGTYHIWHYYNDDGWRDDGLDTVSVATSAILGVVKGSNTDGKIFVESDGTMTMNGYDAIITALANLAANKADDDAVYHEFKLNYNGTNITKDGQPISFADVLTACNDRTKFVYLVADNRLFIPQYTDAGIVSFSCAYVNDDDLNIRRIRYLANGNITSAVVSTYTKAQIDAMISELKETLASVEAVDKKQNQRLENLEAAAEGNLYRVEVDTEEAYSKSVPVGALPWATLDSFGGKSQKWNQVVNPLIISQHGIVVTKTIYGLEVSGTADATVQISLATFDNLVPTHIYLLRFIAPSIPDGTTFGFYKGSTRYYGSGIYTVQSGRECNSAKFVATSNTQYDFTANIYACDLTNAYGAGNEPTSVDDPRIAWIEQYAAEHPDYDEGSIVSADVSSVDVMGRNLLNPNGELVYRTYYGLRFAPDDSETYTLSISPDADLSIIQRDGVYIGLTTTGVNSSGGVSWLVSSGNVRSTPVTINSMKFVSAFYSGGMTEQLARQIFSMFQVNKGFSATPFAPYTSTSLPIPAAVRALDGYGETGAVVDITNKTYTAPDGTVTDISELLADFDNNIKVEGGGSITFENAAKLPVPNQETYLIDIQEAIANG